MIDGIRELVEKYTGPLTGAERITDRRGVQVWRVTAAGGPDAWVGQSLAVKIATSGDERQALASRRELAVLRAIARQSRSARTRLIDGDGFTVTPWFGGPSTWELFGAARRDSVAGAEARRGMLDGGAQFCRAVADLHHLGWVHADLQAAHCIHTADGAQLIDFANAQGPRPLPETELNGEFAGGMAHPEAPELAAMLALGRPAVPTYASDVYALAASLWTAATGRWPLDYSAAGVGPQAATQAELRAAIGAGAVPLDRRGAAWPELLDALTPALDPQPRNRPTATQLAECLDSL
ncbi:hypothetical protein [Streptomyces sp. CB01881]|uniref:hypothetical protein n=1 Tax=Streptomyces sp. CB01881 TaxID=2078691 RepID=UPI000CDCD97A|nr:hypothetical protein [Streptomyces sp. CB01881]AUY50263.1 hypothetical protein C2142_16470 [Streptomyces sp. CB01881]TYC73651.1 hypothetical protein EH183_16450 [Streptomyces sp. CB01881]